MLVADNFEEEFALLEASLAIARIVQKYPELHTVDKITGKDGDLSKDEHIPLGDEPQTLALVLSTKDGCWVRLCDGR